MSSDMNMNEEDVKLREQLQRAVRGTDVPPHLETRIRASIRAADSQPAGWLRWNWLAAAATLCVAVFGGVVTYQLGHLRFTSSSQESYIASVSNQIASIMRVGLRDHIHCSVFRKYPKEAPKLETIAARLPEPYRPMIPVVQKHVPQGFQMMITHECGYGGRKFIHLSLRRDLQLLSVVLATREQGESFRTEELIPALTEAGIPLYQTGVQRFQVAAFESSNHLVYVISDLSKEQNLQTMMAMAPELNEVLRKLEL
jgi:hypothetical protein